MALQPGELTDAIEEAFGVEYAAQNGAPLPAAGSADRRLLFAAVARGLLAYLEQHEDELFRSITMRISGGDETTYTVTETKLDIRL